MKDVYIDFEKFKLGLYALEDTTKAPFGSARTMRNMIVTDRGGIGPRPGTEMIGSHNTNTTGIKGFYNFRKSFDQEELLVKTYDTVMEVYSKRLGTGWFRLKSGFTADKEFGFVTSLVNTDSTDYCVFCNRYEEYQRWNGAVTQLNGALVGGETAVTVDSVLTDEIFLSATATANSATTLTVSTANWASSQWVNLYIYIPSTGKIRKITANTGTVLTFDTLGGAPGNVAFQIRKLAFPATGTLIYNNTTIAYTGMDLATTFTVASAHAAADNTAVAIVPEVFPAAPRGNRMTNYLGRIMVGRVRSAMSRDAGGALQGYSSGGSYFTSKLNNPTDFGFSAVRVPGEGDIVGAPYGGGEISDIVAQEETVYVFKPRYIEAAQYSQDSSDLIIRDPLKSEIGAVGRAIKGSDDVYFITEDKRFTSIGRVSAKDVKPGTENIGLKIKRLLQTFDFAEGFGIEHENKLYLPAKSSPEILHNDILIVYNKDNESFDGIWDVAAFGLERFDGDLHYAESNGADVYKMLTGHADVRGTDRFPISAQYASHFLNLTASKGYTQALHTLYFEGYIKGDTNITFQVWKDFANDPLIQFDFSASETGLLDGQELKGFLGSNPIGFKPMGSVSESDPEGYRHFQFRVYFSFQYGNFFSVGFKSSGLDDDYELSRFGFGLAEEISYKGSRVKSI